MGAENLSVLGVGKRPVSVMMQDFLLRKNSRGERGCFMREWLKTRV